jgi:coenzyme F420-reducing hydrogenase gamma subunit
VDVYIAGCPPRPEALQDGVLQLRELVRTRSIAEGRSYERALTLPRPGDERAGTTDLAALKPLRDVRADDPDAPAGGDRA